MTEITLLVIAILNFVTAFLAFRTKQVAVRTEKDIKMIEVATNNMKDALVASTAKAAFAEGHEAAAAAAAKVAAAAIAAAKSTPPQ